MKIKHSDVKIFFRRKRKLLRRQIPESIGRSITLDQSGRPILRIRVRKKEKIHQKLEKHPIEGMRVEVVEDEMLQAFLDRTAKHRPALGGVSIGHYSITAGTLSCLAYNAAGTRYILSNNHVLAACNNGSPGDDIYQPGPYDGGGVSEKIGELASYVTIVFNDMEADNEVDCAIALPTDPGDVIQEIVDIPAYPSFKREPVLGESIIKSGRTSAITTGHIIEFGDYIVGYGSKGWAEFVDQIFTSGNFGKAGDSGSLVLSQDDNYAVGLLFAGNTSGNTVLNRIVDVCTALSVTLKKHIEIATEAGLTITPYLLPYLGDLHTIQDGAGVEINQLEEQTVIDPVIAELAAGINILPSIEQQIKKPKLIELEAGTDIDPFTSDMAEQIHGSNTSHGLYRIADDTMNRWEVHKGTDEEPDFSSPSETSTDLPFVFNVGIDATYYIAVRKRNKYNLDSLNINTRELIVNADGDLMEPDPEGPAEVNIVPAANAKGYVEAIYYYDDDDKYAATHWAIFFTDDGSDPDPELDSPTVVAMTKANGKAVLKWTSPAADDGDTLKVLVRTRRTDDTHESNNTDIHSCIANDDGPEQPTVTGFVGRSAEIK